MYNIHNSNSVSGKNLEIIKHWFIHATNIFPSKFHSFSIFASLLCISTATLNLNSVCSPPYRFPTSYIFQFIAILSIVLHLDAFFYFSVGGTDLHLTVDHAHSNEPHCCFLGVVGGRVVFVSRYVVLETVSSTTMQGMVAADQQEVRPNNN